LNGLPQSMPKTFGAVPAVLPEAGPGTSMVRARIDLNAAFDWPSHFSSVVCCDDRLNSPSCFPSIPFILGDACALPFPDGSVSAVVFIAALEFLEDPIRALREAVRVARNGVVAIALNRYSIGGLSRRWGEQARGNILSRARDYSLGSLRAGLRTAAGSRLRDFRWGSALFPDGLWKLETCVPLGDVIGIAASLADVRSAATKTGPYNL
jgi:SAM-dependent methyltransferase